MDVALDHLGVLRTKLEGDRCAHGYRPAVQFVVVVLSAKSILYTSICIISARSLQYAWEFVPRKPRAWLELAP